MTESKMTIFSRLEEWSFKKTLSRIHDIMHVSGYAPLGLTVNPWRFYWLVRYMKKNGSHPLDKIGDIVDGVVVKVTVRGIPIYKHDWKYEMRLS
jgi:hypothetical protein